MTSYSALQKKRAKLIDELVKYSDLDADLVGKIVVYSESLASFEERLISETTFISQLASNFNLTNQYMIDLIFSATKNARSSLKYVTIEEYCKLVCVFLTKNLDTKINFVFSVYDIDNDNTITKYEVFSMLRPCVITQNEDEKDDMLKELIELVIKVVDTDTDGRIDPDEFRTLVKKNFLYIELLGHCLPDEKSVNKFEKLLRQSSLLELKGMFFADYTYTIIGEYLPRKSHSYYPFPLDI